MIIFILQEIINIFQSVLNLEAFRRGNMHSFKKIALYSFTIFMVSLFSFIQSPEGLLYMFDFYFIPLFIMIGAVCLSEIFKEGNRLFEDEIFTVNAYYYQY